MLPTFPEMKKLEISDKKDILEIIEVFPPYSDYNFTSLIGWNLGDTTRIATLHGNLIIRFRDYVTDEFFYSFLGNNKLKETLQAIQETAEKESVTTALSLMPEIVAEAMQKLPNYETWADISEDRSDFDYIYDIQKTLPLEGSAYKTKRNSVNQYLRNYAEKTVIRPIDLKGAELQSAIDDVTQRWMILRNKTTEESANEIEAIGKCVTYSPQLDLTFLGLYIDDILEGFSVCEVLMNGYSTIHFEKVATPAPGCMEYLTHASIEYLGQKGCVFVNYQQDLGLEGLRKTKESWQPARFLKKYTIDKPS